MHPSNLSSFINSAIAATAHPPWSQPPDRISWLHCYTHCQQKSKLQLRARGEQKCASHFFVDVNFSINYFCTSYFLSSRLNLEKPLLPHYCYQQKNMIVHSEGKCTSQLLLLFMIFNYILTPCPHHAYYLSPQFKSDFPLLTNNLNSIS